MERSQHTDGLWPPPLRASPPSRARRRGAPAGDDPVLADVASREQERGEEEQRGEVERELGAVLAETGVPALLVTHDFTEAAMLGTRVGVIDGGRVIQQGTAAELAASPASAFVADFTGAVVLTGTARPADDGLTHVALDGGGTVFSTEPGDGPVAVSVYPWEIALEPVGTERTGSAQNHLPVRVVSVTAVGNRVRIGLAAPQPLTAELSDAAVQALELKPEASVVATWKAAATRLLRL